VYQCSVAISLRRARPAIQMLEDGRTEEATTRQSSKHHAPRRKFTHEEDERLRSLVEGFGTSHWESISQFMPNRTARQCRDRYKNYLLDSIIVAPWQPEEDEIIRLKFGEVGPRWVEIAKCLTGRSGNHVKNRWHKHLSKKNPLPQKARLPKFPSIDELASGIPMDRPLFSQFPSLSDVGFPFRSPFRAP